MLGGFHIQADNIAGLTTGRQIADHDWEIVNSYSDSTARR